MTAVLFLDTLSRSLAAEILSYPVLSYMIDSCPENSKIFCPASLEGIDSRVSAFSADLKLQSELSKGDKVLLFCAAAP